MPAVLAVVEQVFVVLVQFVQAYASGEPVQAAVSVTTAPMIAEAVEELIVHVGRAVVGGGAVPGAYHVSVSEAGEPVPAVLLPATV